MEYIDQAIKVIGMQHEEIKQLKQQLAEMQAYIGKDWQTRFKHVGYAIEGDSICSKLGVKDTYYVGIYHITPEPIIAFHSRKFDECLAYAEKVDLPYSLTSLKAPIRFWYSV